MLESELPTLTSGPTTNPADAANIGVAAHITAASSGGPRFDAHLSSDERQSAENGIWLCQNHAKLVDDDETRYSVDLLREWKRLAEAAALLELEQPSTSRAARIGDVKLLRFYSQCLDRPAFQDPFIQRHGSTETFDKAIEDTITAFNSGCLRARDGEVLARGKGKSFLENPSWRTRMDTITDMLRAIRSRYATGKALGQILVHAQPGGGEFHRAKEHELAEWIDRTRQEALSLFSEMCREAEIPPLHFVKRSGGVRASRY